MPLVQGVPLCWNIYVMLTQRWVYNGVIVTTSCNDSVNVCSVYLFGIFQSVMAIIFKCLFMDIFYLDTNYCISFMDKVIMVILLNVLTFD